MTKFKDRLLRGTTFGNKSKPTAPPNTCEALHASVAAELGISVAEAEQHANKLVRLGYFRRGPIYPGSGDYYFPILNRGGRK